LKKYIRWQYVLVVKLHFWMQSGCNRLNLSAM
jgi:hypothetical protein